jgi:hypothetical protein
MCKKTQKYLGFKFCILDIRRRVFITHGGGYGVYIKRSSLLTQIGKRELP